MELHPTKHDKSFSPKKSKTKKRRHRSPSSSSSSCYSSSDSEESNYDHPNRRRSKHASPPASGSSARAHRTSTQTDVCPTPSTSTASSAVREEEQIKLAISNYFKDEKLIDHDTCCSYKSKTYICRTYNNEEPNKVCDRQTSHVEPRKFRTNDTHYNVYMHACSTCYMVRKLYEPHRATCDRCPVRVAWHKARQAKQKDQASKKT